MKLKSLEISGFKSFADKTVIEFMPGMTGIVGPNGSGKSNIIEAIRWVMGEQSAKDLRGTKMTDVIFGGTSQRGALNRSEVSMTFDNSDHYVKSNFNEIRITRKLYRSGESTYQINGVDSRLRDIHELFMDTGLGRESFSIISQGRVEGIFNAKPEERRGIIEEVAGVYKYKQNKERAQKELSQTSDNLSRVSDIIHEIHGRMQPLAEQSARATDYIAQKERFNTLDKARLALTHRELAIQIQSTIVQVELQDKRVNQTKFGLDKLNKVLSEKRQERVSTQLKRDELQQDILALTQSRERLIGAKNLSVQQISTLEQNLKQKETQVVDWLSRLERIETSITQLTDEQQVLQAQEKVLKQELAEYVQSSETKLQQALQQKIDDNRHAYIQIMQTIATLHNTIKNDTKTKNAFLSQTSNLSEKLIVAQKELTNMQANIPDEPLEQKQRVKIDRLQNAVDEAQRQIDQASQQYQADEKKWYKALNDLNKVRSQRDAVTALDDYAGFYQGVRALMQQQVRQELTGIQGVVAELLTVPSRYTQAIETVLGAALQQVVVDTTETAKQAISYLTKKRAGRVTILPIDTIKPRHLTGIETLRGIDGFIGIAAELVEIPAAMNDIKFNLLGSTVIADNLDAATQIARAGHYHFRVVSLDGQVVNAGGSMTGGANQKSGSTILKRQTELNVLNERVTNLTAITKKLEQSLQTQRGQTNDLREVLNKSQSALLKAKNTSDQVDYELSRKQDAVIQQERLVNDIKFEQQAIDKQLVDLEQQVERNNQALEIAQHQQQEHEYDAEQFKQDLNVISLQAQTNQDVRSRLQADYATVQAKIDSLLDQHTLLNGQRADAQTQLDDARVSSDNFKLQLADAKNTNNNDTQVRVMTTELETTQAQFDKHTQQVKVLSQQVMTLEDQFAAQQETLRINVSSQSHAAAQLARLETKLDNVQTQLLTQYDVVDVTDIIAKYDMSEREQIESQLQLLEKSLDEIGSVNIEAITEYEEVKMRFDFLTQQRDDLNQARDILLQTIDEMDQEVQTRFKATFDAVAAQFSTVFAQMFGGGRAEIYLTDPKHLLTTGIDITAQPPGKKFQQMSLLSGGEKALTAITLLFAILHVRPVPFVVLDEAEAALDEANVDRFAKYLYHFSGDTQFIVITHRKGTMIKANLLYGVTMQEAGVSKMIAVDLDNVTESVE